MKLKLLAAVASVAFVATSAAYAQDNANRDKHPEPQRNELRAPAAAPQPAPRAAQVEQRREEPKAGQMETRQPGAAPRNAQVEPRREEPKAGEPANAPRNAQMEKRREEPKTGQMETRQPGAAPRNAQTEPRREEPKTGQMEKKTGQMENKQPGATPRAAETERREQPGQGAAGARTAQHQGAPRVQGEVNMSTEHATRVGEILREHGRPERVDVNVRVGERIPGNIEVAAAAAGSGLDRARLSAAMIISSTLTTRSSSSRRSRMRSSA